MRQFRRDRRTLAMVLLVPVVLMSLVGYLVRNQGPHRTIAVADSTGTAMGARLVQELNQTASLSAAPASEADARRRVEDGGLQAAIVISGANGGPTAHLILEGTDPSNARAIQQLVSRAVLLVFASGTDAALPVPGRDAVTVEYVHGGPEYDTLDFFAPALMGFFAFFLVFLLTAVSFQRERSAGTLERLMAGPIRRVELIAGYSLGFGFFALLQAILVVGVSVLGFRIHYAGSLAWVFLLVIALSLAAVNLGIFVSAFARTEFQAMQFIPLVIVPQGLLSGVIWPVSSLPRFFRAVSRVMPLTYAIDALRSVMLKGEGMGDPHLLATSAAVIGFALLFVALAVGTLRREVA